MIKMLLSRSLKRSLGVALTVYVPLAVITPEVFEYCQAIAASGLNIVSTSFRANDFIPSRYAGDGGNVSPEIHWSAAPSSTRSFAVICVDADAPNGHFVHWVAYDIPPNATSLAEGASAGTNSFRQGTNSYGRTGWNGPAPPPGKLHHYNFTVYALKTLLGERNHPTDDQLRQLLRDNLLASGQLVGVYKK